MNCPKLVCKYYTPKIVWYQTDTTVIIRILLQDIEKYFLQVQCDQLLFSTIINSKCYCVSLNLFGTAIAEETTHINLRREIKVTLVKAYKWAQWLRLCIETEKNPLIVLDPDHIYKHDWMTVPFKNKERESFTEYKLRNNITQIMPDVPSTDEEESDDEVMDMLFS